MSEYRRKAPSTSERRLNAISAGYDLPEALLREYSEQEELRQRVRTFAQDTTNDLIYAMRLISGIAGAATVVHGPRGCAMALLDRANLSVPGAQWAVTNLNERDTIMGSERVLRESILSLDRRYRPELIFIVTTPVVAINNDDVLTVVGEIQDEIGARLVPVFSDGFNSRVGRSGYDLVLHALFRDLIIRARPTSTDEPFANLITISEHRHDREELGRLLAALGIRVNPIPNTANRLGLEQAAQARWSIGVNPDESEYLGVAGTTEWSPLRSTRSAAWHSGDIALAGCSRPGNRERNRCGCADPGAGIRRATIYPDQRRTGHGQLTDGLRLRYSRSAA